MEIIKVVVGKQIDTYLTMKGVQSMTGNYTSTGDGARRHDNRNGRSNNTGDGGGDSTGD